MTLQGPEKTLHQSLPGLRTQGDKGLAQGAGRSSVSSPESSARACAATQPRPDIGARQVERQTCLLQNHVCYRQCQMREQRQASRQQEHGS